MTGKVAIVGLYPTGEEAPFEDTDFDIWTLNGGVRVYKDKRITKWFDLHNANYMPHYLDDIPRKPKFEVVMLDDFPYDEIIERYGHLFENSLPMMMAYAGLLDYHYIYLFGVNDVEFINTPAMGFSMYHVTGALRMEGRKVYFANYNRLDSDGYYGYKDLQKTRISSGFKFKHLHNSSTWS